MSPQTGRRAVALSISVSALAMVLSTPVFAQDASTTQQADNATPAAAAPEAAQTATVPDATEIVVTGSRIRRPEFDNPNPIVSLTAERIQQSGTTNLTDFLTGYPALQGSMTSRDNSGDRAGIGYTGLNLLDLRNLGTDRTLVLVDGRRHVSGVPGSQAVDINTIPTDLVDRIDVLTGGASAIYGADGVSGVVNFVLKKDFEGISARAQAGITEHGDAGQYLASVTAGHNFAGGRGNIAVSYEYARDNRLEYNERDYLSGTNFVSFRRNPNYTPGTPGSYRYIPTRDARYADTSPAGAVDVNGDFAPDFDGYGNVWNPGSPIPGGYTVGGSSTPLARYANDLLPKVNRNVVNAVAHFDVSPALSFFAEGKYANIRSYSLAQPTWDYNIFVPADNPYIPANIRAAIDPALGGVLVSRDDFDFGQRGEDITRETIRGVFGARGDLSDAMHYEASYVYGRTNVTSRYINDIYDDRFYAAIDAVRAPDGSITCRANLDPNWQPNQPFYDPSYFTRDLRGPTTFGAGQCSPINLFGENTSNPAGLNFIRANTVDHSSIEQHVVSASLSGDLRHLFTLPGGNVGYAVGAEYRKEISNFRPDPLASQGYTFTNSLDPTHGHFDVKEAYVEIDLPILRNVPFFQTLDIGAAARYSDYSTTGSNWTWKVDGTWAPIRDIRFRGTYSRAVRAPNIGELFGGASQDYEFIDDPCNQANIGGGTSHRVANCQALLSAAGLTAAQIAAFDDNRSTNLPGIQSGNQNLKQETADTWTAGVVLQPSFLRGFSLSLDWYNIKLANAINTVDPQQLAQLCVDQPTINNVFCSSITRQQGTGLITTFSRQPQNVASFRTAGLDVNLSYTLRTSRWGIFGLQVVGNYLHKLEFVGTPGADPTNSVGLIKSPKYQVNTNLTWTSGALTLNYNLLWQDKQRRYDYETTAGIPDYVDPQYLWIKQAWVHNIYASVNVGKQYQLFGGVNNLFNQLPDIGSALYPVSAEGRRFFVGARVRFGGK